MAPNRAFVVTGGGRGIGRAMVEGLLSGFDGSVVVAVDLTPDDLGWADSHASGARLRTVAGDASQVAVAEEAAEIAGSCGTLAGWVNNAAVFRDANLHKNEASEVMDAITLNLGLAVVGCSVAVRHFLAAGSRGAIVNVSSHQAQRAVRGALPYATAKAAIEGLTRAVAVDYGPHGIRTNAVALGSVRTERYSDHLKAMPSEEAARTEEEMHLLHPVGRVGSPSEVSDAVAYLLSDSASFINGAILPVDGGRSALGRDPEETDTI